MATKSNAASAIKRNLDAIDNLNDDQPFTPPSSNLASPGLSNYSVKQIPFDLLEPNHYQTQLRPEGPKQEGLRELADNMVANGFTSMILVRPHPQKKGRYELGYGHRRLEALKIAATLNIEPNKVKGLNKIPARIAETATDAEWLDIAVSENLSREDLTPLAIANSFNAIRSQNPGISLAEIARRVGRSKTWVQRYDAINGAPSYLVEMIEKKHDSLEHLFILKGVSEPELQRDLARQVLNGTLTLAGLKEQIGSKRRQSSNNSFTQIEKDVSLQSNSRIAALINQLENNLVYLHRQLELESYYIGFDQQDKLESLISKLAELSSMTKPVNRK